MEDRPRQEQVAKMSVAVRASVPSGARIHANMVPVVTGARYLQLRAWLVKLGVRWKRVDDLLEQVLRDFVESVWNVDLHARQRCPAPVSTIHTEVDWA